MRNGSLDWWEWKRQGGAIRFILQDGLMGFGGTLAALTLLIDEWADGALQGHHPVTKAVMYSAVGGVLYGATLWAIFERRRTRHVAQNSASRS